MNSKTWAIAIAFHLLLVQAIQAKPAEDAKDNTIATDSDEDLLYREKYAKQMLSFMNQSVDPCDDFYEYACGNWKNMLKKRHTNKGRCHLFDLNFDMADMAAKLLESPEESLKIKYDNEIKQARMFYESCLKADLFPLQKSLEYLGIIRNISGFPAIDDDWKADKFDWFNAVAHLSVYGVQSFVREDIQPTYPYLPYYKLPEIGLDMIVHSDNIRTKTSRGYILNEQRMRQYLTTYGVVEPKATEIIDSIFQLWHAILNVADEFNEDQEKCVELGKAKLDKTKNKWPKWRSYFDIVWHGEYNEPLSECPCAYFYIKLDEIIQERKEAAANYLALKFLYHMDSRLEGDDVKKDYCNQKVLKAFKYLIDDLYMKVRDLTAEKHDIGLVIEHIRAIFREKLQELPWLDEQTRKEALRKESRIKLTIGRFEADEIMEALIKQIGLFEMQTSNFESNNLQAAKLDALNERYLGLNYDVLDSDTKPTDFYTAMQAQAVYYQVDLMIYVLAGVLYPPVYHKSWPWALKYGTLGYAVGHEVTHAFDTTGATIDSYGESENWWTTDSLATFDNLTQCFIDKYNQYEIQEIQRHVNGNNTKDENIADHGGLRYAFKAYQQHIKELMAEMGATVTKSEQMPGLDMTPEQLFYLGAAQVWCADYKEEHIWQDLEDAHTFEKYRVIGVLSDLPEFAEAYKCPVGSKMNPLDKKCKLW